MRDLKPVQGLRPFTKFCMTIGNLPSSYLVSLTYEEQLLWLCNYLKNKVIPTVKNNAEAVEELQNLYVQLKDYVDNYFKNLDVQEEINNKLDEMAENGTLESILLNYTNLEKIYNTHQDLLEDASNLYNNQKIKTLGFYNLNDGGGASYLVTNTLNENKYQETLSDNKYIELINNDDFINVLKLGAKNDGTTDITSILTNALNYFNNLYFPNGKYLISSTINLTKNTNFFSDDVVLCWSGDNLKNNMATIISSEENYSFKGNWGNVNNFSNLNFEGLGIDTPCGSKIKNCYFTGNTGIKNARVSIIDNCSFSGCSNAGIETSTDSKITNCYFYSNNIGIYLLSSNDNQISNNKFEWNTKNGIECNQANYNNITLNTFDRNTQYGIYATNCTFLKIIDNLFERNLVNHINISGNGHTILSNDFLQKNSEDDQSGTIVPNASILAPSIINCVIKNNNITTNKMFQRTPDYQSNNFIEDNYIKGQSTTYKKILLGNYTVNANTTENIKLLEWSDLDFFNLGGYNISVIASEATIQNNTYYNNCNLNFNKHVDYGLFCNFINNTENSVTYNNIYVTLKNNTPFAV